MIKNPTINIFSENIHETIEVEEKRALDRAKKILNFYLNEENIFKKSCLFEQDFNCISFDILYCDNKKTHEINKEYRKKDYPADIITFAVFADGEEKFVFDGEINLGEVIISLDKVLERGKEGKKERGKAEFLRNENLNDFSKDSSLPPSLPPSLCFEVELDFLISHGIMHLLGFDHQTNEDYTFIIEAQTSALKKVRGEK